MTVTVGNLRDIIIGQLSPLFGEMEAKAMMRILMEDVLNYSPVEVVMHHDTEVPDFIVPKIMGLLNRLEAGEPIQYVIGRTRFCGFTLRVTPDVLIPRPETQELVDFITDRFGSVPDLTVLDVCTGSGCIAIALARALRFPTVYAVDVSSEALAVARTNAADLGVKVDFIETDALNLSLAGQFDIIVSNPPYVAEREKVGMEANVLNYEPHLALFVPDDDPLRFYKAIASYAIGALKPGGILYFEINPLYAEALTEMLHCIGFVSVDIIKDIHGRSRFAVCH